MSDGGGNVAADGICNAVILVARKLGVAESQEACLAGTRINLERKKGYVDLNVVDCLLRGIVDDRLCRRGDELDLMNEWDAF